jgi:hypothetical protein
MKPIAEHGQLAFQTINYPEVRLVVCTLDGGRRELRRGSWIAICNGFSAPLTLESADDIRQRLMRREEVNLGIRVNL